MGSCDNYKDVMENYFPDDRLSPSFRWHLKHGPGHLFGKPPGSEYYRSNRGIKCRLCTTKTRAEKEMVRHMKFKHPGEMCVRTPNSKYCFRVDLTKVRPDNYDKTPGFLLPNKVKSKKKRKSTKPQPKPKETPKPKKARKARKSKRISEVEAVLPVAAVEPSPSSSAVDADDQALSAASVSNSSDGLVVNPAVSSSYQHPV